jgi:single-strand DNA-binding protein
MASRARRVGSDDESRDLSEEAGSPVNEVRLRGRLAVEPEPRELPSGDRLVSFRLVVERVPRRATGPGSQVRVDTLDCAAFSAEVRRKLVRWGPGDIVEVEGSLRRRFFRAGGSAASRYEVEVRAATRVLTAAEVVRDTMAG